MKKTTLLAFALSALIVSSPAVGQDKGKAKGGAGVASKGKDVFEGNCAVCHHSDSVEALVGPGLKGLYKRPALANKKKVTDANVMEIVKMGGNGMPSFDDMLSNAEKADVLAYLKTL
jgi:mono/diheme cytochrome c family protein